jgi:hypothetical protein
VNGGIDGFRHGVFPYDITPAAKWSIGRIDVFVAWKNAIADATGFRGQSPATSITWRKTLLGIFPGLPGFPRN